jgi:Ribonuclease III domain
MSSRIISELFGKANKRLITYIKHDWVSNTNWMMLALSYRLDRYLSWSPKTARDLLNPGSDLLENLRTQEGKKKDRERSAIKYWGDIWEAYWGSLILDRELWNEDTDDLAAILRELILLKYGKLLLYSTEYCFQMDTPISKAVVENDVKVIAIRGSNDLLEQCLGSCNDSPETLCGYLAKVSVLTDTSPREITVYAVLEEDAIKAALAYANLNMSSIIILLSRITDTRYSDICESIFFPYTTKS